MGNLHVTGRVAVTVAVAPLFAVGLHRTVARVLGKAWLQAGDLALAGRAWNCRSLAACALDLGGCCCARQGPSRCRGRCGVVPRYRTAWEGGQGAGEGHRAGLRRRPGVDQENGLLAHCLRALDLDLRLLLDLCCSLLDLGVGTRLLLLSCCHHAAVVGGSGCAQGEGATIKKGWLVRPAWMGVRPMGRWRGGWCWFPVGCRNWGEGKRCGCWIGRRELV